MVAEVRREPLKPSRIRAPSHKIPNLSLSGCTATRRRTEHYLPIWYHAPARTLARTLTDCPSRGLERAGLSVPRTRCLPIGIKTRKSQFVCSVLRLETGRG